MILRSVDSKTKGNSGDDVWNAGLQVQTRDHNTSAWTRNVSAVPDSGVKVVSVSKLIEKLRAGL